MKSKHLFTGAVALTAALGAATALQADPQSARQAADSFPRFAEAEQRFGFLEDNCMQCHNAEDWAGSLAFDLMSPEEIAAEPEIWEEVIRRLRGKLMPPAGADHPSAHDRGEFLSWIEDYLDHAASLQPHIGHVGLHRLNRKEYANAVRDLLGIEVDPRGLLPADPTVEGFDNVAAALRVSSAFLDQSLSAARVVAEQAIGDPDPRPGGATYRPGAESGGQYRHVDGLPLGTRGGLAVEHYFPADGEYVLNIGDMASALWVFNQEFTHTLIATLNGEKFFELEIGGGEDLKAIDQIGDPAVDAINARLKDIRFQAQAGPQEVAVTFVQRSFAEYEGRLFNQSPIDGENVIRVPSIEIQGPFNAAGLSMTPARNQIFSCYPESAAQEVPCAREVLSRVARKAFRGPVSEAELSELMAVYEQGRREDSFDHGIRRALTAILASPKFLYRMEQIPLDAEPGEIFALSDLELASRLSFFLWSSIPDEQLLDLAEAGRLQDPQVLREQLRRMLADPRAENLASNFAYQWLNLGALDDINPDPAIFRDVDDGIRDLFKEELRLFVGDIFLNNRNVTELMTADWTYMNERLAVHYGDRRIKGDQFRKVALADERRAGLLGKGGVQMASSYPDRTAPSLRGAYVLEHLTGTPPPPPPPNVEANLNTSAGESPRTIRELLEQHRANPSCNSCHGILDSLGLALENFDAVGRFREIDRVAGMPIDSSGVLPDGRPIGGINDLREALLEDSEQLVRNLTRNLMLFALGRPIEAEDMPTVRHIVDQAAAEGYRFFDLVEGIVGSDQFLYKQAPADGAMPLSGDTGAQGQVATVDQ